MSAAELASVSAFLRPSRKKRSEGTEAVGTGERSDQWAIKESRMMLAICFVPLSLRSSRPGISQVGLRPGVLILSVRPCCAISVKSVLV